MLGGMRCETTSDAGEFWDVAGDFLCADPVVNSVIITNVLVRRRGEVTDSAPPTFLCVLDDTGSLVGAAMRTPPHAIAITALPAAAIAPTVAALRETCRDAVGVWGAADSAKGFADEWSRQTGQVAAMKMQGRIHRLDSVRPPAPVAGAMRLATMDDVDLLARWTRAFIREAEEGMAPKVAAEEQEKATADEAAAQQADAAMRIAEKRTYLWEHGEPVSFVRRSDCVAGAVRIGPVYTPPERRGRGYASALVAAVSQRALDEGAETCCLHTDLANPTSNKIYAAVGYRPVCDVTHYRFEPAG